MALGTCKWQTNWLNKEELISHDNFILGHSFSRETREYLKETLNDIYGQMIQETKNIKRIFIQFAIFV